MKRIVWKGLLLAPGLATATSEAGAQAQTSGRAVVVRVPAPGEVSRFQVPQVRLANAVVARYTN
jgi:hypothetical protein